MALRANDDAWTMRRGYAVSSDSPRRPLSPPPKTPRESSGRRAAKGDVRMGKYGSADLSYGSSQDYAAEALSALMSMLSEDYSCATWDDGIERIIWDDLCKGELFDPVILSAIELLATKCNGWWVNADDGFRLVPLEEWRAKQN